jgi:POT family proton-dependent oligopeptide transporter
MTTKCSKNSYTNHPIMLYVASFTEFWEKFSFFIIESLLVVYLLESKHLSQELSYEILGTYLSNLFILTIFGGYFGQSVLGVRNSITLGAIIMSAGCALLLIGSDMSYVYHGLALIVTGGAFFNTNMAYFVGALYKKKSGGRYHQGYSIYYACVEMGFFLSALVTGYVLDYYGWGANFSLASLSLFVGFIVFWVSSKIKEQPRYLYEDIIKNPILKWLLTLVMIGFLWAMMHFLLQNSAAAYYEIYVFIAVIGSYLIKEGYYASAPKRFNLIACVILMIFVTMYWMILFQIFFSFNLMVSFVINRHLFHLLVPGPFFMGIETMFMIFFSLWLSKIWNHFSIGIFTKYCHAVPIKDRKPPESIRAMTEVLDKIAIPENLYSDNKGSWNNKGFIKLLNQHKIKHIITSSPPPFAERVVQ